MSYEKGESQSQNFGSHEEWAALEMIGEITVLPVEILGDLAAEAFEGFIDD